MNTPLELEKMRMAAAGKVKDSEPVRMTGERQDEAPRDPWAGRSEGMRCSTCMWFVRKKGEVGRCRRHAPTMSGFPVVYETDWCGDHKLDENRGGNDE